MRLCPKCGKKSQEARCPDDGTATLVLAQNPDARLTEGTEINGRYRIGNMIGQGGFGAVYKAKNIATDQDMAIKLLAVSLDSDDSDVIQRFFAEAQVTASLKHPNTIRVFDFGQTEGGALYIAMELLSGKPLNEELRNRLHEAAAGQSSSGGVMTEDESITVGVQVLRSLAEAHLANLVHRDLKPHNIFLHMVEGDDPVVKVLDFGIAKRLGSNLTGTGKAFGTPAYMSPEQAQNKKLDRRSDLYSLGCVLFQCVAGMPPFDGDNPLAVLLSHVTDTPPDLRMVARTPVSDAFVRVVERALSKNADDRFASAIEMRQALEACRGSEKTETLRTPQPPTASPMAVPAESGDDRTASYDGPVSVEDKTAAYAVPSAGPAAPRLTPVRGSTPQPVALPGGAPPPAATPQHGSAPAPEATAAFSPAFGAGAATPAPAQRPTPVPTAGHVPTPVPTAGKLPMPGPGGPGGGGDHPTYGFFSQSEAAGVVPAPRPDPVPPAEEAAAAVTPAPVRGKGPLYVAIGVAVAGAVALAIALGVRGTEGVRGADGGDKPAAEAPQSAAVAATAQPQEPEKKAEPVVTAGTGGPGADAGAAAAADAVKAPSQVEVVSDPPGATILVDGKAIGPAPRSIPVPPSGKVAVKLELAGYEDVTLEVAAGDGKVKVPMQKDEPAEKKTAGTGRPKSGKSGSSGTADRPPPQGNKSKSALEERL